MLVQQLAPMLKETVTEHQMVQVLVLTLEKELVPKSGQELVPLTV
jgi:hypothetical protein